MIDRLNDPFAPSYQLDLMRLSKTVCLNERKGLADEKTPIFCGFVIVKDYSLIAVKPPMFFNLNFAKKGRFFFSESHSLKTGLRVFLHQCLICGKHENALHRERFCSEQSPNKTSYLSSFVVVSRCLHFSDPSKK